MKNRSDLPELDTEGEAVLQASLDEFPVEQTSLTVQVRIVGYDHFTVTVSGRPLRPLTRAEWDTAHRSILRALRSSALTRDHSERHALEGTEDSLGPRPAAPVSDTAAKSAPWWKRALARIGGHMLSKFLAPFSKYMPLAGVILLVAIVVSRSFGREDLASTLESTGALTGVTAAAPVGAAALILMLAASIGGVYKLAITLIAAFKGTAPGGGWRVQLRRFLPIGGTLVLAAIEILRALGQSDLATTLSTLGGAINLDSAVPVGAAALIAGLFAGLGSAYKLVLSLVGKQPASATT